MIASPETGAWDSEASTLANQTVHDPVCHMDITVASAAGSSHYEGQTYYFCAIGCKRDFDEDQRKRSALIRIVVNDDGIFSAHLGDDSFDEARSVLRYFCFTATSWKTPQTNFHATLPVR